jgi:hypothetical protein
MLIQNFDDFINVFNTSSDVIDEFMLRAFIETPMTKRVTNLMWNPAKKKIVLTENTAMLSNRYIQK